MGRQVLRGIRMMEAKKMDIAKKKRRMDDREKMVDQSGNMMTAGGRGRGDGEEKRREEESTRKLMGIKDIMMNDGQKNIDNKENKVTIKVIGKNEVDKSNYNMTSMNVDKKDGARMMDQKEKMTDHANKKPEEKRI